MVVPVKAQVAASTFEAARTAPTPAASPAATYENRIPKLHSQPRARFVTGAKLKVGASVEVECDTRKA
jgi:hypothetical protein